LDAVRHVVRCFLRRPAAGYPPQIGQELRTSLGYAELPKSCQTEHRALAVGWLQRPLSLSRERPIRLGEYPVPGDRQNQSAAAFTLKHRGPDAKPAAEFECATQVAFRP